MSRYSTHGDHMIEIADAFATAAHGAIGQIRKYTGEPYITHPRAVAGIVQAVSGHTWEQVCVALLHDVVEDTQIAPDAILETFGATIAEGVSFLTNVEQSAGNRAVRYAINCAKLGKAPGWVQTVKVADLIHNTKSIVEHDPQFAKVYLREKAGVLRILRDADPVLVRMAYEQIGNQALGIGAQL